MSRLTKKILEESRKMMAAWVEANPEGDRDWYIREIAGIKGVDYKKLVRKLVPKKGDKKTYLKLRP